MLNSGLSEETFVAIERSCLIDMWGGSIYYCSVSLSVHFIYSDVNKVKEGIGDKIANFWQWTATFLVGIIIGFAFGWKLALVILAVSPLLAISGGLMAWVSIIIQQFNMRTVIYFCKCIDIALLLVFILEYDPILKYAHIINKMIHFMLMN